MRKFTAVIQKGEPDQDGFPATCLEVPGANGHGETRSGMPGLASFCHSGPYRNIQFDLDAEITEFSREAKETGAPPPSGRM